MHKVHIEEINTWTIESHPNPEKVFECIRSNWHDLYGWQSENRASIQAFADHFNLSGLDWQVSTCSYSYAKAEVKDDGYGETPLGQMSGVRLWKYLNNSGLLTYRHDGKLRDLLDGQCPFTGYCFDEWLLDPIREFITRPDGRTFQDIVNDCLSAWVTAYVSDWEYAYTDEALRDLCEYNAYEFTEDGEFYC